MLQEGVQKTALYGATYIGISWHRYYDPSTGRYLTPDPIGLRGGMNLFLYADANPIMFIDPTGLVCGDWKTDWVVPDKPGGNDFTSCCQKHDDCYGDCGKTKEECDNEFYECMARKCKENFGSKKCYRWADTYWDFVDEYGQDAYDNAQNPRPPYPIITEDDY